jgi:hypothetical protein
LKDDIYNACLLPRKLVDPKDSGFGESGVSYIEQFKPFARMVYRFQSILLNNITQLIKIHLIHTGDFELDEIEFSLSMPYPESQTNNDIISAQSSLLELANNVISAIEDRVTGGEKLPPELIKTIYNKFLPYDSTTVDFWVDEAVKAKEEGDTVSDEDDFGFDEPVEDEEEMNEDGKYSLKERIKKSKRNWRLLENKVGKKVLKETVNEIIFECFNNSSLREGSMRGQHFFKSKNNYSDFNLKDYVHIRNNKLNKLKESVDTEIKDSDKYDEYLIDSWEDSFLEKE